MMANMVDFDLEPQEALDALRFSALIGTEWRWKKRLTGELGRS